MSGDLGPQLVTMGNYQVDVEAMCRAYDKMIEAAEELMRLAPFADLKPLVESARQTQAYLRFGKVVEVRQ